MRITAEREALTDERDGLEKTLKSKRRLTRLIRGELLADAEKFGDQRRSSIHLRTPARALDETSILPTEPITVVLSERGWVRSAKGHEIDPASLGYKAGDQFQSAALGRSNQIAIFLDSSGRTYSLPAHTLPSARGLGEPLSGRLNPPDGATFKGVMIGDGDELYVLCSDAGYGFMVKVGDLYAKNKAGKTVLALPAGAEVQKPSPVVDPETDRIACISSDGRLLLHALNRAADPHQGKRHQDHEHPYPEGKNPRGVCPVYRRGAARCFTDGARGQTPPDAQAG